MALRGRRLGDLHRSLNLRGVYVKIRRLLLLMQGFPLLVLLDRLPALQAKRRLHFILARGVHDHVS